MTASEEKRELRKTLRAAIANLPARYVAESDEGLEKTLLSCAEWKAAKRVFIYHGVGREPATAGVIAAALRDGKTAALPRCGENGVMRAYVIRSLGELSPGTHGIPEPEAGEELTPEETELAVVPGLCFDEAGFRLGQGGGYYDRWLSVFRGFSVGLCRQRLLVKKLPREEHDMRVGAVATENGIVRV